MELGSGSNRELQGGLNRAVTVKLILLGLQTQGVTQMKFNVQHKPFRAQGSGLDYDCKAIHAALKAAQDGSTVFFPNGTYLVSKSLSITRKEITVLGEFASQTALVSFTQIVCVCFPQKASVERSVMMSVASCMNTVALNKQPTAYRPTKASTGPCESKYAAAVSV